MFRLPSPRKVSQTIFQSKNESDEERTHMLMQFGQFLAHDMTRTTKEGKYIDGSHAVVV